MTWMKNRENSFFCFKVTIIVGLITYLTMIVNQPVCADPLLFLNRWKNVNYQLVNQGRWSSNFFLAFRGYLVVPALSCIILIVDCAITAVLFNEIFDIKNKYLEALIGGLIVAHPHFANLQMYYCTSGVILYSLIMFSLWISYCSKINYVLKVIIISAICTITIAYEQATICLFTTVTAMKLILDLLSNRDLKYWKSFLVNFISAIIGCVLYLIVWKYLISVTGIKQLYGGANDYSLGNTITSLPSSIRNVYNITINYLFGDSIIHNSYWKRQLLNVVLVLANLLLLVGLYCQNKKDYKLRAVNIAFVLIMFALLPIALAPVFLVITNYQFYLLTAYGFVVLVPFTLVILSKIRLTGIYNCLTKIIVLGTCAITLWSFIWSDNAGALLEINRFNQSKALANRMLSRIEDLNGFSYDMPVCFIGHLENAAYEKDPLLEQAAPGGTFNQVGVFDGVWEVSDGWGLYIKYYEGVKLNYLTNGDQDKIINITNTDQFKNMACFPDKNSVQVINNTVVVKLSNDTFEQ